MIDEIQTILRQTATKRTTSLSDGQKLCGLILAICAAPLFKVNGWMAVWLLTIITVVGLLTFGLWFYRAITGKSEPTEEHVEHMAAIGVWGKNTPDGSTQIHPILQQKLAQNPNSSDKAEDNDEQL